MPPRSKRTVRSYRTTRNTREQPTKTPENVGSGSETAPERVPENATDSATANITSESTALTALKQSIAAFFAQGQKSTIGHRMLVNNLRQLFDQCVAGTGSIGSETGVKGPSAEKLFCHEFCQLLNRVLVIRKGEVAADRCLRLADSFVKNLIGSSTKKKTNRKKSDDKGKQGRKEKDGDVVMEDAGEDGDENEVEREEFVETEATHAVLRILHHLVPLSKSRTKWVRYRTAQFLALLLSNTFSTFPFDYSHISLTIFLNIRNALLDRIQDKESIVRVQAVIGLVRLMEMGVSVSSDAEDESVTAEPQDKVEKVLIETMQSDPSADVRRTVLYNLTPTPTTFEYFIERARDIDISTRRAVFRRLLTTFDDFRLMSLVLRENLLSWGFNDADKSVRLAAKKVFSYRWLKDAEGDVLELLERLDVVSEGVEQGSKYTAMMGFWEERGDLLSTIDLNSHEFWENLTPESSFLARTFNDYYRSISSPAAAAIVEARLPELSKMTDYLKKYMNKYIVMWQDPGIQESSADLEFTIMQLLKITCSMDFSDEVGRRRLFALLRECLGVEEMSGPITVLVCDGVRKLSHGEYDFSLIVVEAIAQIRQIIIDTRQERETKKDSDDDSASFHTANDDIEHGNADLAGQNAIGLSTSNRRKTGDYFGFDDTNLMEEVDQAFEENQRSVDPAVVVRELSLNLKCLHLAQCVLERVKATNGDLFSMIPTCVVPAVRSHAPLAREGGIRCLGLFGILDINLAKLYLDLICYCLDEGHKELKILALEVISDFLVTHRMALFENPTSALKPRELYIKVATATTSDAGEEVQCLAFKAICKFMLARIILESQFLKMLVISYFKTSEVVKPTVHSVLKTFLPLFCHSSTKNAKMMARISVSTFHTLLNIRNTLPEDSELKMLKPAQIASRFMRWTDPREAIAPASQSRSSSRVVSGVVDGTLHAIVARKSLELIASRSCAAEERKLLCSEFLAKCYLPAATGKEMLQDVYDAVVYVIESGLVIDATGKAVLDKVEAAVGKILGKLREVEGEEGDVPVRDNNSEEERSDDDGVKREGDDHDVKEEDGMPVGEDRDEDGDENEDGDEHDDDDREDDDGGDDEEE